MNRALIVDLFVEDRAHEEFLKPLVQRIAREEVERWYLADPESFHRIVGKLPGIEKRKCKRDYYKNILTQAIRNAGYSINHGGVEFAPELIEAMDFYRAGQNHHCLKFLIDELRDKIRLAGITSQTKSD